MAESQAKVIESQIFHQDKPNKSGMQSDGLRVEVRNFMQKMKGQNLFTPVTDFNQFGISTIDASNKTSDSSVKLSNEDMQTLKEQIKDAVRECANRSSVHAFPSLSTKGIHPIIVVMWIVCCLVSWGYLCYQIYNTIVLYNAFGVSSSISVKFEVSFRSRLRL